MDSIVVHGISSVRERASEEPQHKCYILQVLQSHTLPNMEDVLPQLSVIFGSAAKVRSNRQNLFVFFLLLLLQTGKGLK